MANGAGKVPVIECSRGAWMFLVRNWRPLLPAAAICAVISQIGTAASVLVAPQQAASPTIISFLPTVLAGVMFTAMVLRKAVRDEYIAPVGLTLGRDEARLVGVGACVALIAIPVIFVLSIVVMSTIFSRVAATPEAMEALAEDPEAMMKAIEQALGAGGMTTLEIASIVLLCIVFGLVALVQAATIGEKRIVLFQALGWIGGNVLRVLGAFLLTAAPALIISTVFGFLVGPLITDVLMLIVFSIVAAFVGYLTSVPIAALGAVLYKGLRPADFVAK